MTLVDVLSDTTYREQAIKQVNSLLIDGKKLPVARSQIYGLRQIARQQPGKVEAFAKHQKSRAQSKQEKARNEKTKEKFQSEIDFWERVGALCSDSTQGWSVQKEGKDHLPEGLQNIPEKQQGMTHDEQGRRNELNKHRREWLNQWNTDHIPAFFERFCTEALYREGTAKKQQGSET